MDLGGLGAHLPRSQKVWLSGKEKPTWSRLPSPKQEPHPGGPTASRQSQFGIILFHSWASNGAKTGLFIFTDGANFSETSNVPDFVRTEQREGTWLREVRAPHSRLLSGPKMHRTLNRQVMRNARMLDPLDGGRPLRPGEESWSGLVLLEDKMESLSLPSFLPRQLGGPGSRRFISNHFQPREKDRW